MRKIISLTRTALNQSKCSPSSALDATHANELYELMHDPVRIISLPVGLRAGIIITGVA